ncbi:MAG: transglutaminase family protein [Polyangiales bacterium]
MRLLLQHRSHYGYPRPAALGPHVLRLRPANHVKATIETYALRIAQGPDIRWQQDPYGNHIARASFRVSQKVEAFDVHVELTVDVKPVNPFDFLIDDTAKNTPFKYPRELLPELRPFLDRSDPSVAGGPQFEKFLAELPHDGPTVPLVVELNRLVNQRVSYVIREESGVWTPENTLTEARGSCRDSATLLIAVLRARGFAARFASGYLVQLTDEGMIPDAPKGMGRDVVDLHAWAEVFLPGAGWIGLDATSGLLCGEGHIPLACTSTPALASPIEGTSDVAAHEITFEMSVARLGHEARPTAPYEPSVWAALVDAGDRVDRKLESIGVRLTMGGEPTFNARENTEEKEWKTDALGDDKWAKGVRLVEELRRRLAPHAAVLVKQGKHYPGESLPRWAMEVCGRRDGGVAWRGDVAIARPDRSIKGDGVELARRLADAIAERVGLKGKTIPAYEDPWRHLQEEASLPVDVDPLAAKLEDGEERRRLARVLDRGLGREAGFVLPLTRIAGEWRTESWTFRRGHLFLLMGDSPIGLRLPLRSLPPVVTPSLVQEEPVEPMDPRRSKSEIEQQALALRAYVKSGGSVRTALSVEARAHGGASSLHVFLPPLSTAEDFFELLAIVDDARTACDVEDVVLEGYGPPSGPALFKFAVTPDPGVLEVNLPPTTSLREYTELVDQVFDAALHAGLHSEKYMVDGRMAGSGGGHHLTFGGEKPLDSLFVRRPDVLASLLTFVQHHPSLSYMFTGLFVGPTSQAPRVDEARHDSLYELEIALAKAHQTKPGEAAPWLSDLLFRNLLVDISGNTHRAEICIDKLFDPNTPHGRQGLVELRAFEMPPHPRMAIAQMVLVRALLTAFAARPYEAPLVRFGTSLHDRYLLPYWMWRDFEDVLAFLEGRELGLPADAYRPFLELRCPVVGTLRAGDVRLEVRNAIEPWNVLGEETTASGTSRYVDSSMERIEVRAEGLVAERHAVLVNGYVMPMRATPRRDEHVGGIRFRAWAPPHALHAHLGIHHPVRLDVVDLWAERSIGACAYHVWHPEGRSYDKGPLTSFEASARRAQRFTIEGPLPSPVRARRLSIHDESPYSIDLRRFPIDRPMPVAEEEEPE